VSYKEFFDALEPRGEALIEFLEEVRKEEEYEEAKKKAEADTQLGLLETQAAKRAPLVIRSVLHIGECMSSFFFFFFFFHVFVST
jgi:hypothetical protein